MDNTKLSEMNCVSIEKNASVLDDSAINELKQEVPEWELLEKDGVPRLKKTFAFKNFAQALAFTNKVGVVAEEQNHHPLIVTEWGNATVTWWSHKINGLHKNDFIMSAKTDEIYKEMQKE
jgi:4a-hydroxytetrahydrobiopterin dehydratase